MGASPLSVAALVLLAAAPGLIVLAALHDSAVGALSPCWVR